MSTESSPLGHSRTSRDSPAVLSPGSKAIVFNELSGEREVLRDPEANLVRRLEALYALKTAAFEVHPRIVDSDRCRVPRAAVQAAHDEHVQLVERGKKEEKTALSLTNPFEDCCGIPTFKHGPTAAEQQQHEHEPHSPVKGCEAADANDMVRFVVNSYHMSIDTTDSVLLQHELLYNLGQLGSRRSIPVCVGVIKNYKKYSEVSRHEAIEALGAIGFPGESVPALKEALESLPPEALTAPITESAELAFHRLGLVQKFGLSRVLHENAHADFVSVDPAPSNGVKDLHELRSLLMDPKADLFSRYQAMFALRNVNTPKAVEILCEALVHDKTSCLFRHEVAFVLGQMEYPSSTGALKHALLDETEHGMVRHEAAEAMGAIGTPECKAVLTEYQKHADKLVSDSCYAAIQLMEDDPDTVKVKYGDGEM